MRALIFQLARFGLVGVAATGVHFVVALALHWVGLALLWTKVAAFLAAFQVSYWGHSQWSFGGHGLSRGQSLRRFFGVSIAGFLVNEGLLFLLTRTTELPAAAMLAIVLVVVAMLTFAAS